VAPGEVVTETAYLHRAAPRSNRTACGLYRCDVDHAHATLVPTCEYCGSGTIHPKAQAGPMLAEDKRAAGPLYTCRCGALVFERDRAPHVLEEHPEMFTRVADAAPRGAP
jgi:hypothetical protein